MTELVNANATVPFHPSANDVLMRRRRARITFFLAIALASLQTPAFAQAPTERQSDNAVKALLEQVDTARDKFENNLDDSFKDSTIRSATGEIKVEAALQDLQDNTKKLKNRFTDDYAASAEADVVLKLCTRIGAFMERTPSVSKGRSEWDHFAATLKSLAGVYGTTFPLPDGATVRRMNDKETEGEAEAVAKAAGQYKKQIEQDKTLAKPDQESAKKMADEVEKAAKTLKSRLSDGKPATAEVQALVARMSELNAFTSAHPVPPAAAAWTDAKTSLAKIEQSFRLAPSQVSRSR